MRYFWAKRQAGPVLIKSDRIDTIFDWLKAEGLDGQFHPSYTRMVPAHHVVELQLDRVSGSGSEVIRVFSIRYRRFCRPTLIRSAALTSGLWQGKFLSICSPFPEPEPLGVCFSGGIDSGSVFLTTYHVMRELGMSPARLKAFVLDLGNGPDLEQARAFLDSSGLGTFREPIEASGGGFGRKRNDPSDRRL